MVQGLPELYGVYQGVAVDVGVVVRHQVRACEHEGCNLPVVEPDAGKFPAHAQVKRAPEDIRCLQGVGIQWITSFPWIDF